MIEFKQEAQNNLVEGINIVANAVKTTLGAKGSNVVIEKEFNDPHVTKDGVTVAKNIHLTNRQYRVGAEFLKQVAVRTAEEAGDGTTTSCILAQALVNNGVKYINFGADNRELVRGIEFATWKVIDSLKFFAEKTTDGRLLQIATISANNDPILGKVITEALLSAGQYGVTQYTPNYNNQDTYYISKEGMELETSLISPYLVNDEVKNVCNFENPLIFIFNKSIKTWRQVFPFVEKAHKAGRPIFIIAEDFEGDFVQNALAMKVNQALNLRIGACKAPSFGDNQQGTLQDIATLLNTRVYLEGEGQEILDGISLEDLGTCDSITSGANSTAFLGGKGDTKERIAFLQKQIEETLEEADRIRLEERLARLLGGVSLIFVGAKTPTEQKEKLDRVDDALRAAKAALSEGFIVGGGLALLKTLPTLKKIKGSEDFLLGVKVVAEAIQEPLKQLARNSRLTPEVVIEKVNAAKNIGLNGKTNKYENLLDLGVVDPLKVVRVALSNASSIACMVLTTECMITLDSEEGITSSITN